MAQTKMANMVNPEVLKDMISAKLEKAIRFAPLARIDRTLEGQAGNTVTVPRFEYIGDADDVAEGVAMGTSVLTTSTQQATIKKAGKAVELTDESVLSGYGDPIGEAGKQLRMSIVNKIDNDSLEVLATTTLISPTTTKLSVDAVEAAQDIFNDEDQEAMVLICSPKAATQLRKDAAADWTRASDLGDRILITGVFGEVLGAQVIRSNKLDDKTAYLVKAGALAIYLKRVVEVETDRDILKKTTVISADEHYGVVLEDESKAVKITIT
ncbi:N4-gp56 family major capsid protein [Sporosarcina sp. P17b]|uniref:N4-gp56 family major capsid protein n=1 Tax=Sporosarcina sp. P17b TaxID=2048260 RepID=UPI000C164952|nr:N4-gp56 family major capsid protein [Sporosarcina sp. P17b]PIC73335.1 N4-gp56 family major capsid protein [Sporosarcina sp. P17b]